MTRRRKLRRKMCIPRKRVSRITRGEVGMKKKVRLRRRFWKNHGEVCGIICLLVVSETAKREYCVWFGCWMRRVEEASSGIYT